MSKPWLFALGGGAALAALIWKMSDSDEGSKLEDPGMPSTGKHRGVEWRIYEDPDSPGDAVGAIWRHDTKSWEFVTTLDKEETSANIYAEIVENIDLNIKDGATVVDGGLVLPAGSK